MSPTAGTGTRWPFLIEAPAAPEQLRTLRERLGHWLRDVGCDSERAERLLLAMNEAATNSVEHAYRDRVAGPVWVGADIHDDGTIVVNVSDEGSWRPARPDDLRGKGVLMMQECGDDVRIHSSDSGTEVEIVAAPVPHEEPRIDNGNGDPGFDLACHSTDSGIVAEVSGDVAADATCDLRRQLLAATCGGLVPLAVDIGSIGVRNDGAVTALEQAADAARGVGGSIVLVVPHGTPPPAGGTYAWTDLDGAVNVVESL